MNKEALTENDIYEVSEFFKNLADFSRVKIITSLLNEEKCVQDIAKEVEMSQTAVSYQLRILRHARLVKSRRDGKMVYYQIMDQHVAKILEVTIEHLEHM
ncbi:MAG: ArsR/SmtB family transcription factor [Bacilli bacterium]